MHLEQAITPDRSPHWASSVVAFFESAASCTTIFAKNASPQDNAAHQNDSRWVPLRLPSPTQQVADTFGDLLASLQQKPKKMGDSRRKNFSVEEFS